MMKGKQLYFFRHMLYIISVGVFATFCMELWSVFLNFVFHVPFPNYANIGRWIGNIIFHGEVTFTDISKVAPVTHELLYGWITHYFLGIFFSFLYIFVIFNVLKTRPSFIAAVLFSLVLVIFPFYVEQPVLGMGIAASETEDPNFSRMITLSYHAIFGVGLYFVSLVLHNIFGEK